MASQIQQNYLYKIVLTGDPRVGKSNILLRFTNNNFKNHYRQTIGVDFANKLTSIEGKAIQMQVWDTSSLPRYRNFRNICYRRAVAAVVVFDLTQYSSFLNVTELIAELRQQSEESITLLLLGNKSDLIKQRQVKSEQIEEYVNKNRLLYFETSAENGRNVNEAFMQLLKEIYLKEKQIYPPEVENKVVTKIQKKKKWWW